jgi:hypothetical protein
MRIVVQPRQRRETVKHARSDAKPPNREALGRTRQARGHPETPRRRLSACARLFQKLSGHAGPPGALTWGLNRRVRSGMDVGPKGTIRSSPEPPLLFSGEPGTHPSSPPQFAHGFPDRRRCRGWVGGRFAEHRQGAGGPTARQAPGIPGTPYLFAGIPGTPYLFGAVHRIRLFVQPVVRSGRDRPKSLIMVCTAGTLRPSCLAISLRECRP